jgi:hypothetical protein
MVIIQSLVTKIRSMSILDGIKSFEDIDLTVYNFNEFLVK